MMNRTPHQRFFIPMMQGLVVIGVFLCSTALAWSQTGQVFQGRKVYSNNASWGEIVVNFCDSSVTGKFIGSPRNNYAMLWSIGIAPPPEFDGRFAGVLQQNGECVGTWYDNNFTGNFAVRFFDDFSTFEGTFTRNTNEQQWNRFWGNEKLEWMTIGGKRSPVYAGIASFFVPGLGQHYNREYEKSNVHYTIGAFGLAFTGVGSLLVLGAALQYAVSPWLPQPMQPSSSSSGPESLFRVGAGMFFGGAITLGTTMIVSSVDAVISADRINADMNTQAPYQCLSAPSVGEPRFGLEVGIANAAFMPQPSINLALYVPLY